MKHILPLMFVALLALGMFSVMGLQGQVTGLAGPMKHVYPTSTIVPSPQYQYVIPAQGKVFVFNSASMSPDDCVVARQIQVYYYSQGMVSDDLNAMLMFCAGKGW